MEAAAAALGEHLGPSRLSFDPHLVIGRRQLPVHSPLSVGAIARSLRPRPSDSAELRQLLMSEFRADSCMLLDSGTHALQVALDVASLRDGPVAIPAFGCYDLATAALGAGVEITFYDVAPDHLVPDLDDLRLALARGASVVVAANVYGHPQPWTEIRSLCRDSGAILIEDAAQGLGSEWEAEAGGAFGDLTVLSFGRGKGWTGGGGGALLSRLPLLSEKLKEARDAFARGRSGSHSGWSIASKSLAQWLLGRPSLYGIPSSVPWLRLGETIFKEPSAPDPIAPVCVRLVLEGASSRRAEILLRRENGRLWDERLDGREERAFVRALRPCPGGVSGYLRFPVMATDSGRAALLERELRGFGVARGYPRALYELPSLEHVPAPRGRLSGALELSRRLLTLPTHRFVDDADRDAVVARLDAAR